MSDAGCAYLFIAAAALVSMLGVLIDMARTLKRNKNLSQGDTYAHRR